MRLRLSLLLLPIAAFAQIDSVATNADGSRLWFNSGYALRGSGDVVVGGRVYEWNASSPKIIAQATDLAYTSTPFISSDERTYGWQFYYPCRTGSCGLFGGPRNGLHVTRAGKTQDFVGVVVFASRNGRYVVQGGTPTGYPPVVTDLDTGSRIEVPDMTTGPGRHGVADDGTLAGVVRFSSEAILIAGPGKPVQTFQMPEDVYSYSISADARVLFAQTRAGSSQDGFQYTVRRIDITSGAQTELLSGPDVFTFDISADGGRVLLFSQHSLAGPADLLLWEGEIRNIATAQQGYKDMVVSDDGTAAYAVELSNRLLKVNLSTGAADEILPAFPSNPLLDSFGVTPGSAVRYSGFGFTKDLEVDSDPVGKLPVIDATPISLYVQAPWEIPQDVTAKVRIGKPGYPFELYTGLYPAGRVAPWIATVEQSPYFRNSAEAVIKAAQPDFKSLVSSENPAAPGSTIHAWLTGLGPLDRPVPTGVPGPDDPPSHPLAGPACYLIGPAGYPSPTGLELPSVAYAPGLIGVYQVDMTIPTDWPEGLSRVRCESSGLVSQDVRIPVGARQ